MQDNKRNIFTSNLKHFFTTLSTKKAVLVIVIVGIIVFGNALFNGFVWDDKGYVINNPELHSLNFFTIFHANVFSSGVYYRPVIAFYFASLYSLFKDNPFFYHIIQIFIHILNTVLVFLLFKKFFKEKLSLFFSLIFLIHPMQVESVSYIAASAEPIFFFFGVAALIVSFTENVSLKRLLIVFGLLLLSILSKETGIIFLFLVLLRGLLVNRKKIINFIIFTVIFFTTYFILRTELGAVYFKVSLLPPITRLTFIQRLINIPAIVVFYLKTFLFPIYLSVDQLWIIKKVNFFNFYFPMLLLLIFLLLLVFFGKRIFDTSKKKFSIFIFFLAWFFAGLFLIVQFVPLDMTVAERWFYLPMVGLLGAVAISLQLIKILNKKIKLLGFAIAIFLVSVLSIRSIIRNTNWIDPITLYTHDSKIIDNFDIENNIGNEYASVQDYENALMHFKRSVEFFPYETNLFNIGSIYEQFGNKELAKKYYLDAIDKTHYTTIPHKHIYLTYERLGYVLYFTDNLKSARTQLKLGVRDYPDDVNLWLLLAVSDYKLHNQNEALAAVEKAKVLFPNDQTNNLYKIILNNESFNLLPKY